MREITELPGPRGLPWFGNAFQVQRARIHRDVEQWAVQHGPLFRISFGPRPVLCVADHELVAALLRDRPDGFRRSTVLERIGREMGLQPGLFGANGDAWRRQRRMVMAAFDPGHVRAYFPSLLKVAMRLQGRWQRAVDSGAAIELQPELMRFTVDAISGLAFGADVNTLESDDEIIQRHLDKIFPALFRRVFSILPTWRYWRTRADRELERSVAEVNAAIAGFVAEARGRLADPARRAQPQNLLEAMIVAAESDTGGPHGSVTDAEVSGNVLTMLLAGEDTTANTLAWLIHLLHAHPGALRRARDEVRSVAGELSDFTPERIGALDYLDACAHEAMRLKPVAPFQVVEALRDTSIGDVRVPTDSVVWCVMRHDALSERHFTDAAAFRPERWLGDEPEAASGASAKRVSMPFGSGPRICPGRYLALLEIKLVMAMLLAQFEIERVDTPDGAVAEERMAFTMMPVGLRMRLRRR